MRKFLVVAAAILIPLCAYAADTTVTQSHSTFDSDSVTVKAGDNVVFANKDDITHNIQVINDDGDVDDKGLQKPGENIKVGFTKAGTYKIRCSIHPKMKMTVVAQ